MAALKVLNEKKGTNQQKIITKVADSLDSIDTIE